MTSANVKGIAARQVVTTKCAAKPFETRLMNHFDRVLGELRRKSIWKCKVADRLSDHLFQFILGVSDFMRSMTIQELSQAGLREIGPVAMELAMLEGLDAHSEAVRLRLATDGEDSV